MSISSRSKRWLEENIPGKLLDPVRSIVSNSKQWMIDHAPAGLLDARMRRLYGPRPHIDKSDATRAFSDIYESKDWGTGESVSGSGSSLQRSQNAIMSIERIVREKGVRTLLDVPCGDFNWMRHVRLGDCNYIGGDIVDALIQSNILKYQSDRRRFLVINLAEDELPQAQLLVVRDCLFHLPEAMIRRALANVKRCKQTYLLTTTFPFTRRNWDIDLGGYRPINLCRRPFNLPPPLELISEEHFPRARYLERHLGLWHVDQL